MNKQQIQLFGSSKTDEWETPNYVYNDLDKEFNFDMDACASDKNFKHPNYYSIFDNALLQDWGKRVFCNPPYSKVSGFLAKAWLEIKKGNTDLVVFLLFSNTDTKWFHHYIYKKAEIRFIKGRLKFIGSKGVKNNAMRPSMVVILRSKQMEEK